MWDFEIGRTLGLMARTWPFIVFRMIVYFGMTLAYIVATGAGAGIGFGVGHIIPDGGPAGGAFWGGILGFCAVSVVVYWLREYILYILKAGHIAVLVQLIEARGIPDGQGQIDFAKRIVTARFGEANVLFALDQLIKGVVAVLTGMIAGFSNLIPIPGLQGLARFINTVIRLSLTYVDEIILGYNIRLESAAPYESARKGIVLYAQNGAKMVKNAVWLAVIMWGITLVVFLVMLAPAAAILYIMPGQLAGWGFVLAIVFAWAVKAALVEPFVIAALMQVYFRTVEGQVPDPDWDARLETASRHFRELKDKAAAEFGFGRTPQAGAA